MSEKEYSFDGMYKYLDQYLLCGICYEPAFDNLECFNCSNLFCTECIAELEQYYDNLNDQETETYVSKCPHCRSNSQFYKNLFATKVLGQIELPCDTCHQKIKHININDHLDHCLGKLVACELCTKKERTKVHQCLYLRCNDCRALIRKTKSESHKQNCKERLVSCKFCGKITKNKDKEAHETLDCGLYPVICEFCENKYARRDVHKHAAICDEALMNCGLCKFAYTRVEKHICTVNLCRVCNKTYIHGYKSSHIKECVKKEKDLITRKIRAIEYNPYLHDKYEELDK